jgi:hypothetical protein
VVAGLVELILLGDDGRCVSCLCGE